MGREVERPHDVRVDEPTWVTWSIDASRPVRQVRAVGFSAVSAREVLRASDARRRVGRELREALEVIEADVESSMQHLCDLVGREGVEMRGSVRAVDAGGVFAFQGARRAPFGLDWTFPEAGARNGRLPRNGSIGSQFTGMAHESPTADPTHMLYTHPTADCTHMLCTYH